MKFNEEELTKRIESIKEDLDKMKLKLNRKIDEVRQKCKQSIKAQKSNIDTGAWEACFYLNKFRLKSKLIYKGIIGSIKRSAPMYTRGSFNFLNICYD